MKLHRAKTARNLGILPVLIAGAALLLPAAAGAQTPGTLVPLGAGVGSGSVTLAGGNALGVTLSGVVAGASYNVFACMALVTTPTQPGCVIGDAQLVANASGQVSGSVRVGVTDLAIAEVLIQNTHNRSEMYREVVYQAAGGGFFGGASVAPTGGYTAPVSSGGASAPAYTAPVSSGGSGGRPSYMVTN